MNLFDRFSSKIKPQGECLVWTSAKDKDGYGIFYYDAKRRAVKAHRLRYEWSYGDIPKEMLVCHHCDNPSCVRIEHLFLGTAADNSHDRDRKKRNKIPRNEANVRCVISNAVIAEIRASYTGKRGEQRQLANKYEISNMHISNILRKKRRI